MLKKQNHKDKYKRSDLNDGTEGGHYYRRMKTTKESKANNALDRALRQRDFSKLRLEDDDYDYY